MSDGEKKLVRKRTAHGSSTRTKAYSGKAEDSDEQGDLLGIVLGATGDIRFFPRSKRTLGFDAEVTLNDRLKQCMRPLWDDEEKDKEVFTIWNLKPEAVFKRLNRQDKRDMLLELANNYKKRTVTFRANSLPKELRKKKWLSVAAIFVIALASKGGQVEAAENAEDFHPTDLFAELVGCANPDTVEELSPYLRPPFITLKKLPIFIHGAVRQYV